MADAQQLQIMGAFGGAGGLGLTTPTLFALDANNDGAGWVYAPRTTDPITHLGFRYGARTGTPPTYIIGIEGVDPATGFPDGTYKGGGTPASATFTPPADATWNGLWQWIELDNAYTPNRGQPLLCTTLRYSSGTVDASNLGTFTTRFIGSSGASAHVLPYSLTLTAGTWAKPGASHACFGYRTASGRFGNFFQGDYATNITTAGHRQAMHFTLPSGHGDTFKILGATFPMTVPASGNTFKFGLWNAAGTAIQEATYDSDEVEVIAQRTVNLIFDEASLTALSYGTKYYLGIENVSGTIGLKGYVLSSADDRSMFPLGMIRGLSTWNGATWTDDDTMMPLTEPILADITEPAGGGGGGLIRPVGMTGGLV